MFLVLRIDETFSIRISIKRYKYKICEKSINRKIKNAETSLISTFSTIFLIGWAGKIRILQEYFLASLTAPAHPSDAFLLTFHFIPNKKVVTFVTTFSFGWAVLTTYIYTKVLSYTCWVSCLKIRNENKLIIIMFSNYSSLKYFSQSIKAWPILRTVALELVSSTK